MKCEVSLSIEREVEIDAPDASGRLASFSVQGRVSRALLRCTRRVYHCCGQSASVVDTNSRQPSGLNKLVSPCVGGSKKPHEL